MQVSVETISNLERKLTISLPAEQFSQAFDNRVKKVARTAKIDGFRPGKAPQSLIASRYGDSIREEVLEELMRTSFYQALEQEKLTYASHPHFAPEAIQPGQPVQYSATFEIYPVIEFKTLDGVTIEKVTAEITDADIDKVIENLRKQKTQWNPVDRAAQEKDKLVIDFSGFMDGQPLENGSAENADIVIGSKNMIPGFEDGLVGAKAGDEVKLNLQFPEEYHVPDLSGKPVEFTVKVKSVAEPVLPPIDDKLAEDFNVKGGVEGLRAEVKQTLEQNLQQTLANRLKMQVLDKLNELNLVEVPKSLVVNETRQMMQQLLNQLRSGHFGGQMPDLNSEAIQEQAQRRVRLGLLLAEAIKLYNIKLDEQKVSEEINRIASAYDNPQEVYAWYTNNKERMAEIEAAVIEDQIVAKLLEQAKVTEKAVSYDEVINSK